MTELGQVLQTLGQVQGELKNVVLNQERFAEALRNDVKGLHSRIDTLKAEINGEITTLYRKGCAYAGEHTDHETRITQVEDWKIAHDTESKVVAAEAGHGAGMKSGGLTGAIAAALIIFWNYLVNLRGGAQ